MENRRIWVGCLASHKAGILYGEWIDSEGLSLEELEDEAKRIVAESPVASAEEWFVADHEGYEELLEAAPSLIDVVDVEAAIDRLPDRLGDSLEAFAAYAEHVGGSLEDAAMSFEDAYTGEYRDEEEYAEELLHDTGDLDGDSLLGRYFDLEAYTRDLFISDYFAVDNAGGVFVFRNF